MAQNTNNEYALALFQLAQENHREAEYLTALQQIRAVMQENPVYPALLASPAIEKKERLAALDAAFNGALPPDVTGLLQLLCRNDQMRSLEECIAAYEQLYDEAQHIAKAEITSAVPLTEAERITLEEKLNAALQCRVQATYRCDPAILGGLVVAVDGYVLDGSLRQELRALKDVMLK